MDSVLWTSFNPLTARTQTHTHTLTPTHPQNNKMILCVRRSLLAYNIKMDLKVTWNHDRNNIGNDYGKCISS